jgi:hypothetical protein
MRIVPIGISILEGGENVDPSMSASGPSATEADEGVDGSELARGFLYVCRLVGAAMCSAY